MVLSILTERIALYRSAPREARAFPAFLQTLCQFHIEHLIFYTPVILSLGIACYFSLHFEPAASLVFNMWVGSLALLFLCHNLTHQEFRYNKLRVPAYLLCLFISGIFLAQHRTDQVSAPVLQKPLKFADLSGTIRSIDILPEHAGVRLVLNDLVIEDLPAEQTPRTIRLKIRAPLAYRPGQRVTARASLNPPGQMVTPNAFNFQFYSYFKQLGAVGFSYNPPDIISPAPSSFFSGFWESMRLWIAGKITHAMPQSLQGVSITFMTGEKSTIPPDDLAAMRNSGLAHLLAISGLHVGLVAGFIFFLTRLGLACIADWALKYPIKKIAAFVALIFAIFYTCLVGAEVPTQRALMMTGIALFAIMIDRSPFSLRMVALAALV
ncbi:MAG: ComEC/Rec2 family competence protein, partial [Rhodospirillales bacterium]|nr:ComEC/Rec2 family competence protein [Rhodospirillales bacterium]